MTLKDSSELVVHDLEAALATLQEVCDRFERLVRAGSHPLENDAVRQWIRKTLDLKGGDNAFKEIMDRFGKLVVTEALYMTKGSKARAAKLLGLARPTITDKMAKFGIQVQTIVKDNSPRKPVEASPAERRKTK